MIVYKVEFAKNPIADEVFSEARCLVELVCIFYLLYNSIEA